MATAKITKSLVDTLTTDARSAGRTLYVWDAALTGFGVLATKTGSVSYFIEYRLGGRGTPNKRLSIGKHGPLTPDEARKAAKIKLGEVARGQDVAQEKKDERRKLAAGTFKDACEQYLAMKGNGNRSWPETRRILEFDAMPVLGNRPMVTITRGEVAAMIDGVTQRSPSVGRALFAAVRPLFKWARNRGVIESNPIADLEGPEPLAARKRVLGLDELRAFWTATSLIGWPFSPVFRLLLLTAQRKEEAAGMMWEELDLERGIWRLPSAEEYQPARTKNGEEHIVDLSPQAAAILAALPGERRGLVFTTTGTTPVSGFSKVKDRLDALMAGELQRELNQPDYKLRPWRTHDLRRTAATLMGEQLDVSQGVVERILNHVSGTQGGLMGIYQRQQYREKRRNALLAWGVFIAQLTGDLPAADHIVTLAGRR
jgi:integrase